MEQMLNTGNTRAEDKSRESRVPATLRLKVKSVPTSAAKQMSESTPLTRRGGLTLNLIERA